MKKNQSGFSVVEVLIVLLVICLVGLGGWYIWQRGATDSKDTPKTSVNTTSGSENKTTDPYSGWKSATSSRAKFSIKYPSDWVYTETVGERDGVERVAIESPNFSITIHSFRGNDPANTECSDCQQVTDTEAFEAGKLGSVNLETITYKLDDGIGNALVLRQANGTYYMTSPVAADIKTNFRGISKLDSLQAYQNESSSQFAENPDFAVAKLILQSISY